jgi:hypothetical protein
MVGEGEPISRAGLRKTLHCDGCGIDGDEGRGVRKYNGVPYCERCATKKGLI